MAKVTVLDDDAFLGHAPGFAHPERPERLRAIRAELARPPFAELVDRVAPSPATREWMERVHTPEMLRVAESLSARGGGVVDADTTASAGTWRAVERGAGAAVEAARRALAGEPAFALPRPPGHHATPKRAMGFCFVNNVAVAAEWSLREGGARRVAIFDYDVHHGNGTQDAFWTRDDVLYVSTHESPLYPGTGWLDEVGEGAGRGFTLNFPLPAGTDEAAYARVLDDHVVPALRAFRPDLLLVSAGYDAHALDPLGHFLLGSAFFHRIHATLAREVTPRVAAVLEGGYDLAGLARGVAASVAALAGASPPAWDDEAPTEASPAARARIDARLAEFDRRARGG